MRTTPFFKLLLPLIFGILLEKYVFHHNWVFLITALLISFLLLFIYSKQTIVSQRGVFIASAFLFTHLFCWGLFITAYHRFENKESRLNNPERVLTLTSIWKKSKNHYKAIASLNETTLFKNGDVMLMLRSDSLPNGLPGDKIITKQKLRPINVVLNPEQFDYKAYLQNQGIGTSVYLSQSNFRLIKQVQEFNLIRFFAQLRIYFLKRLDSFPLTPAATAFIKALLFGDKSDLDSKISSAFSSAGAMHVLAVSGLHVGIIVSIFTRLLSLFKVSSDNRWYRWFKTIILLLIIWFFAGITGFSPSIVRASIMFSFLSIGQSLIRHTNIYNSLSMAAFFMLLLNPNNLFSVGFQLSFLAVGGIVFFYEKIFKSIYIKSRIIRPIWSISAVSIAAQLVTFPLALFYFHQFPVYFLLSNLIVIPAAFVVLLLSIILFVLSPFKYLLLVLSSVLNKIIDLLNYLMLAIKNLPFTNISDVYIDKITLFLILSSILSFSIYLLNKKSNAIIIGLCFSILIFGSRLYHKIQKYTKHQLIFYAIPGNHSIDLIQNTKHFLFADSLLWEKENKIMYASENFLRMKGLTSLRGCNKEVLEKPTSLVNASYILSKNHLLATNILLCINHSSHLSHSIKKMKHRIVLTKNSKDLFPKDPSLYELIIFNTPYSTENRTIKDYQLTNNSGPILHSLSIDGFYSFSPSECDHH